MEESYIQSVLRGFEGQAKEKQQQVIVCCVDEDVNKQANAFMQLVDRGIGGIALWPTIQVDTPPFQIRQLQDRGVPIVLCHRPVPGAKVPLITVSYRDIGRMAGKKMMAQGHRRIAYFASHGSLATQAHLEGLHAVVEPAGGSCPDEFIYTGTSLHWDISLQEGEIREALQRMAQHPDPPTAIMCAFDTICEQLYMILQGMGYRIPDDISLVGVGDTRRDGAIIRQLSSITIDAAELGRRTAQTLQEMQTGMRPLNDDKTECLPLGFIEGRTLGPPRG
ncbi:MAG: LacI family DNA-binding transcriptional regulator, partial [Pirellulales bacterium]|nr:LacI family DNA-binding transcriptional regulator [Pirellulales bacterium]